MDANMKNLLKALMSPSLSKKNNKTQVKLKSIKKGLKSLDSIALNVKFAMLA